MKRYKLTASPTCSIASLSVALVFTLNVVGQEIGTLDDSVVTGVSSSGDLFKPITSESLRFGGDLEDSPLNVQVIPKEVIKEIQAVDLEEILEFTAGTQKSRGFGGTTTGINIRGFEATFAEDGVVTGGPFADRLGNVRDSASIESVEVLRGPNGALFGEGTLGGVVNVIKKKPEVGRFVNTRTFASSEGLLRQELDANTSFGSSDQYQLRFITSYEQNGNDYRDDFESERNYFSLGFDYEYNDRLRFNFGVERTDTSVPFDGGLPIDLDGNFLVDRSLNLSDPDLGDAVNENFRGSAGFEYDVNDNWQLKGLFAVDDSNLDSFAVNGLTNFQEDIIVPLAGINFIAGEDILRAFVDRDFDARLYTGRFDLKGSFDTGQLSHETSFGIEYRRYDQETLTSSNNPLTNPSVINLSNLVIDQIPGAPDVQLGLPGDTINGFDLLSTNIGLSAFDQITINPKLKVLLGARVDFVDVEQIGIGNVELADFDETAFSPTVGVNYKFNDTYSVYGKYSETFQVNTAQGIDGELLDPEEGVSGEVGLRFNLFENRLSGSASLFYVELENRATSDPFNVGFSESGTIISQGVDFTLQGAVNDNLSLVFNYTYNDTELSETSNAASLGSRETGVPYNQASLLANYKFSSEKLDGLSLSAGLVYVGDRLAGVPTDTVVVLNPALPSLAIPSGGSTLDAYLRTDIGARYEYSENTTFTFKVENVIDVNYERVTSSGAARPEAPRTFFAGVDLKF